MVVGAKRTCGGPCEGRQRGFDHSANCRVFGPCDGDLGQLKKTCSVVSCCWPGNKLQWPDYARVLRGLRWVELLVDTWVSLGLLGVHLEGRPRGEPSL